MRDQYYSPNYAGEIGLKKAVVGLKRLQDDYLAGLDSMNDMEIQEYIISKGFGSSDSHSNYLVARVLFLSAAKKEFFHAPYNKPCTEY